MRNSFLRYLYWDSQINEKFSTQATQVKNLKTFSFSTVTNFEKYLIVQRRILQTKVLTLSFHGFFSLLAVPVYSVVQTLINQLLNRAFVFFCCSIFEGTCQETHPVYITGFYLGFLVLGESILKNFWSHAEAKKVFRLL